MPLKVVKRPGTRALWLMGTVLGKRIRESAGTDDPRLAEERRAAREAEIYRGVTHGVAPTKTFAEAAVSYLKKQLSDDTKHRLNRFLKYLDKAGKRNIGCDKIDQVLLDEACDSMLRPGSSPATRLREVFTAVKAVLRHAAIRGWCTLPVFESVPQGRKRKEWLTPEEAERIIELSPPHLAPLFVFMFCTGARRAEAIGLDWRNVQLRYGRAILRDVKSNISNEKDRLTDLPPRAVTALAALPGDKVRGPVFKRADGTHWHKDPAVSGAQVNRAFKEIAAAAGVERRVSLHVIRHSWASWHYAVHKNLKKLARDGAWDSIEMADRYSHLAPDGMAEEITRFWNRGIITGKREDDAARSGGT